jgi:Flp pilus assembly pilin Flp
MITSGQQQYTFCELRQHRTLEETMNCLTKLYSRIVEAKRGQRGQTMTEYVLIIAAIAVAGYIAYQGLETGINGLITKVTASLNAA